MTDSARLSAVAHALPPPHVTALSACRTRAAAAFAVSVTGTDHRVDGSTGADYAGTLTLPGDRTVVIVADGAGSARHGAWSAKAAVWLCSRQLIAHFHVKPPESLIAAQRALREVETELERLVARYGLDPSDVKTTLAFALVEPGSVIYAGIGDAACVLQLRNDKTFLVVPVERAGQHQNETWLLGANSMADHAFVYNVLEPDLAGVMLLTDGLHDLFFNFVPRGSVQVGSEPLRPVPDRFLGIFRALASPNEEPERVALRVASGLLGSEVGQRTADDLTVATVSLTGSPL